LPKQNKTKQTPNKKGQRIAKIKNKKRLPEQNKTKTAPKFFKKTYPKKNQNQQKK